MASTDRDADGIPDAEQLTIEEIEAVDRHFGEALVEALADPANRAPAPGIQSNRTFDPARYRYVAILRVVVIEDTTTGERSQVNYTRLVQEKKIEIRTGHSIEGGVMGGRAAAITTKLLGKLGTFGSFAAAILGAGGSLPALLMNASMDLISKTFKGKKAGSLLDKILGRSDG